jgi:hypothetical protein
MTKTMQNKTGESKQIEIKNLNIYLALFLVSFTSLLTEILLTRIFSVTLEYHLAFFVVSLAMFGMSFGGTFSFVFRKFLEPINNSKFLFCVFFLFVLSYVPLMIFVPRCSFLFSFKVTNLLWMLLLFLICQLPFFFIGLLMSYLLQHYSEKCGTLYFFDLIGASSGSFLSVFIINAVGAINSLIVLGIFASVSFIFICQRIRRIWSILILVCFCLLLGFNAKYSMIKLEKAKGVEIPKSAFTKWNSFSMVKVKVDENPSHNYPAFGWGISPVARKLALVNNSASMDIDASALTPIIKFDGDMKKIESVKYDITAFAYHIQTPSSVLIIGPGGGKDVLTALAFGCTSVKGVEINNIIVNEVMKKRFRQFSGDLYFKDNVNIIVDDARSYVRNSKEHFDIIQASLIDTWAATQAGAYSLSENNLYTVEAIGEYLNHLTDNGYLTITHWLAPTSLKLVAEYVQVLKKHGVSDPESHIVVIQSGGTINHILKRSKFTKEELEKILSVSKNLEFSPLYIPGFFSENAYSALITSKNITGIIGGLHVDIKPSSDDSPFFFNIRKISSVPSVLLGKTRDDGIFLLYGLLLISLFLGLFLIILPIFLNRGDVFKHGANDLYLYLGFFSLLGMSFMMVELAFLQRFMLFLGHPTYSVLVVLFSILTFSGIGSYCTGKFSKASLQKNIRITLIIIAGIILLYNFSLHSLFNAFLGYDIKVRIAISIFLLGGLSFFMGMPFPVGIRIVGEKNKELIPFCWSLNGVFSVLAAIISVIFSMNFGFIDTICFAAVLYLTSFLLLSVKPR